MTLEEFKDSLSRHLDERVLKNKSFSDHGNCLLFRTPNRWITVIYNKDNNSWAARFSLTGDNSLPSNYRLSLAAALVDALREFRTELQV